jgi:anti-sigma factor RsiW
MSNDPLNIDDTVLLAYVDGELTPEQRAEVEAALAQSRALADRVVALRSSILPYAAAFHRQAIASVPQSLSERVNDLIRVTSAADLGEATRVRGRVASWRFATQSAAPWRIAVAAFVAGVVLCAGVLQLQSRQHPTAPEWVQSVASYQELYARQTLANIVEDHALTQRVIDDSRAAGVDAVVPDLRAAGLTFKRAQRLSFRGQELIQLVYLPASGDPVALCMMREKNRNSAPHLEELGPMHAAAWHAGDLGYVLVAKNSPIDLLALGRHVANRELPVLYGRGA